MGTLQHIPGAFFALSCSLWLSVCDLALSGFRFVLTQKPQEKSVFKNLRKSSLAFILCFSLALFDIALSCFVQKPQEKPVFKNLRKSFLSSVWQTVCQRISTRSRDGGWVFR